MMRMNPIKTLLEGKDQPDIYLLLGNMTVNSLRNKIELTSHNFFYLEGKNIVSKEDLFRESQLVLSFPGYFGHNWAAFDDCITDLSWIPPAKANIILYDDIDIFAKTNPEDFKMAYYGLAYAARRGTAPLPCYVLLRGDRDLLPEEVKILGDY